MEFSRKLDYTIELLMTKLAAPGRRPFLFLEEDPAPLNVESDASLVLNPAGSNSSDPSSQKGALVSQNIGIDTIFPSSRTRLDSYAFDPCGYSANALVEGGEEYGGEGYYTIHVTPEEGWSYASFECNVPVAPALPGEAGEIAEGKMRKDKEMMPDLETLIQRVVNIFQPGHVSLTLFVSSPPSSSSASTMPLFDRPGDRKVATIPENMDIEVAQRVFRRALLPRGYVRTDKINYEFGGYDLAFATFQKKR
jgi:S-adenosylmethionine decarboxylase